MGNAVRMGGVIVMEHIKALEAENRKLREVARMVVEASDLCGFSGPLGDAARAALTPEAPHAD